MLEWYSSLSFLQKIFAYIAVPSTAVLLIQTVMLLIGMGNGGDGDTDIDTDTDVDTDVDVDTDGDGIPDSDGGGEANPDSHIDGDGGLRLFSVRGILAMLCIGGWSGIVMLGSGMQAVEAIILAFVFGCAALVGMAYMMRLMIKLQQSGNLDINNAIGHTGQVYIPIPPALSGSGKITITFQNTFNELSAVTADSKRIPTGETVRVTGTDDAGMLVVERVIKAENENENLS